MPDLVLTGRAEEDLKTLPAAVQSAIVETLTLVEADPRSAGKALRGRLSGLWSCRVGSYRILYTVEGARRAKMRVIVRAISHRGTAYRGKGRR